MKRLIIVFVSFLFLWACSACTHISEPTHKEPITEQTTVSEALPEETAESPAEPVPPELCSLPDNEAELTAMFEAMAAVGYHTCGPLEQLIEEQPEFLMEYLLRSFRNNILVGCTSDDGSVGTLLYSVWVSLLGDEAIASEAVSMHHYWEEWRSLADQMYKKNNYDFLLEHGHWITALYLRIDHNMTDMPDAQEAAPYTGSGFYGFPVTHTFVLSEQTADVDRCGQDEQIQLLHLFDDHGQDSYALRVTKNGQNYDSAAHVQYSPSVWIHDLDRDGLSEILFNGDCASDDYVVYGWHLTDNGLQPLSEQEDGFLFTGEIRSVSESMIDVSDYHHLLGSRLLCRSYTYDIHNRISVAFNWTGGFHSDPLIPVRDLPCKINGTDAVIAAGTPLWITFYDGKEQVILSTGDGTEATISYSSQKINGIPESEYFENLMYAG